MDEKSSSNSSCKTPSNRSQKWLEKMSITNLTDLSQADTEVCRIKDDTVANQKYYEENGLNYSFAQRHKQQNKLNQKPSPITSKEAALARDRIIESLQANIVLKRALTQRINEDSIKATKTIKKALDLFKSSKKLAFMKKRKVLSATIYFEPQQTQDVTESDLVQIQSFLSGSRINCQYDPYFSCFKVDLNMKIGEQFKFIINGRKRVISTRYPFIINERGQKTNVYIPGEIKAIQKKKRKDQDKLNMTHDSAVQNDLSICSFVTDRPESSTGNDLGSNGTPQKNLQNSGKSSNFEFVDLFFKKLDSIEKPSTEIQNADESPKKVGESNESEMLEGINNSLTDVGVYNSDHSSQIPTSEEKKRCLREKEMTPSKSSSSKQEKEDQIISNNDLEPVKDQSFHHSLDEIKFDNYSKTSDRKTEIQKVFDQIQSERVVVKGDQYQIDQKDDVQIIMDSVQIQSKFDTIYNSKEEVEEVVLYSGFAVDPVNSCLTLEKTFEQEVMEYIDVPSGVSSYQTYEREVSVKKVFCGESEEEEQKDSSLFQTPSKKGGFKQKFPKTERSKTLRINVEDDLSSSVKQVTFEPNSLKKSESIREFQTDTGEVQIIKKKKAHKSSSKKQSQPIKKWVCETPKNKQGGKVNMWDWKE